jgi:hypothetical protein
MVELKLTIALSSRQDFPSSFDGLLQDLQGVVLGLLIL